LEVVFVLLEFPSPSRRIFIGSHSLPPSLVRRIGLSGGGDHRHQMEKNIAVGRDAHTVIVVALLGVSPQRILGAAEGGGAGWKGVAEGERGRGA
jgi:hypothetical protein